MPGHVRPGKSAVQEGQCMFCVCGPRSACLGLAGQVQNDGHVRNFLLGTVWGRCSARHLQSFQNLDLCNSAGIWPVGL